MELSYTNEFEQLLKSEAEKAESMGVLHQMSFVYFSRLSNWVNVPVIVLSSFTGLFTALAIFPSSNLILGALSIAIGIIKTLDNYFDWTKRSESHRIVGLAYGKISKLIQIQLALERSRRMTAKDLYAVITHDVQNLKDQEHPITRGIIEEFKRKYKDEPTSKPTIANGLTVVKINQSEPHSRAESEQTYVTADHVVGLEV